MKSFYILFFLAISLFCASSQLYATQTAIVSTEKAIVYSDVELTSAIGFVRGGRQLIVGSKTRRGGSVLPIVVAGKLAYIRVQDVALSNNPSVLGDKPLGPKVKEHKIDLPMGEIEDDLSENNFMVLSIGQFFGGSDLSLLNDQFGVESSAITNFKAMFEHRPVIYDFSWDVGFGLYTLNQDIYELRTLTLEGNVYYSFFKTGMLDLQAYAGVTLSGDFRLTSESLGRQERGAMWGYQFGVAAKMAPRQKYGFVAQLGLLRFNPSNIEDLGQNVTEEALVGKIQGIQASLGFAYKF